MYGCHRSKSHPTSRCHLLPGRHRRCPPVRSISILSLVNLAIPYDVMGSGGEVLFKPKSTRMPSPNIMHDLAGSEVIRICSAPMLSRHGRRHRPSTERPVDIGSKSIRRKASAATIRLVIDRRRKAANSLCENMSDLCLDQNFPEAVMQCPLNAVSDPSGSKNGQRITQ